MTPQATRSSTRLEEIVDVVSGYAFRSPEYVTDARGPRLLRGINVAPGEINWSNMARWSADDLRHLEQFRLEVGDLVVGMDRPWISTGFRVAVVSDADVPAYLVQRVARLRSGPQMDQRYLRYLITHDAFQNHLKSRNTETTVPHISILDIRGFECSIPTISEQRRIAAILDEADALRRKRREALVLLDDLLRSAFLDMFGDPVTNPRGWPMARLSALLLSIDSGWSPNCEARPAERAEWGVLKLGAVTSGRFIEDHKALPEGVEPQTDLEIRAGDLLFTRKNTTDLVAAVAYVHRVRPRLMFPDLVFRLRPDSSQVLPSYLAACLMHAGKRSEVQALAAGSSGSMPGVSKAKLMTVSIPTPPLGVQAQFHRWVECHEQQRAQCVAAIGATEALFAALLQGAFTGKL